MMVAPTFVTTISSTELLQGFADGDDLPTFPVSGLTADSRQVRAGNLFIALPGLSTHAIDFAPEAVHAGAVAVLFDERDEYARSRIQLLGKQLKIHWIAVADLRRRAGQIAARFFDYPSASVKLVGVTGTDGKTSVTHLLVQALMKLGEMVGSIGTLGYGPLNELTMTGHTTPDAVRVQEILADLRHSGCEYVVMEVSSHALDQFRVSGCVFDIAVLTNLGSDHLDYHGSQERYAIAKSSLFDFEGLNSRILNIDDAFGRQLAERHARSSVTRYQVQSSAAPRAEVSLRQRRVTEHGLQITVETPRGLLNIQTGLIGEFNIDNCLAVIAVLQQLGFDIDRIESAMQGIRPIPGRMEYQPPVAGLPGVVIDFAHTAQALEACLLTLKPMTGGDLYCVFGCGGDRDAAKRPQMAAVAERLADHVIVTDDNPRHEEPEKIMRDILNGFREPDKVRVIHDRYTAIHTAMRQAGSGDLVVIAGKGHEQVQIFGDRRLDYSDQQAVRQVVEEVQS